MMSFFSAKTNLYGPLGSHLPSPTIFLVPNARCTLLQGALRLYRASKRPGLLVAHWRSADRPSQIWPNTRTTCQHMLRCALLRFSCQSGCRAWHPVLRGMRLRPGGL